MNHDLLTQVGKIKIATQKFCTLLFTILLSINFLNAQCGNLYIAGALDATLSGGLPKAVQVCATANIADLSIYGIESVSNGGGSNGSEEFNLPAQALNMGDCFWLTNNLAAFSTWFGFAADFENNNINSNGDDAYLLYCSSALADVLGDPNMDGSNTAWEYSDGWIASSDNVANPVFDVTEWCFSGIDGYDGAGSDAGATNSYPFGGCPTFDCPALQGNFGDVCDDGNPTTVNDIIDSSCNCVGTSTGLSVCKIFTCADVSIIDVTLNSDGDSWFCQDSANNVLSMNGFCGGGCAETTDNWLILGDVVLTAATTALELSLDASENFGTTDLQIFYSTSFNGCPDDVANNWVNIGTITAAGTSLNFPLGMVSGTVTLAIQYFDDGANGYSDWDLSNIELLNSGSCNIVANTNSCTTLPCAINNINASNFSCNGTDFEFEVSYNASNLVDASGTVVVFDITNSQQLNNGNSSPILVTIPNNTTSNTIDIVVFDAQDFNCVSDTITISTLNCTLPTCASVGDLIVSEIFNNPGTLSDGEAEYFEIYNTTNAPIDMLGYLIKDADFDCHTIGTNLIVPANGYVVLGANSDITTNGGVLVDYEFSGYFLSNSADEIIIECLGNVIDEVAYLGSWPNNNGTAAELCADSLNYILNDNASAWYASTDTTNMTTGDEGTPGSAGLNCGSATTCLPVLNISGLVATNIYQADDVITSNGQVITNSGGAVTYRAGAVNLVEYVELTSGFDADGTVNFTAINIDCDPSDN